jgi:hypothetical protein
VGPALVAAVLAPWLVWLPFVRSAAAIDLLGAIAIAGAWHGWGRIVARLARRDGAPIVTIAWGLAATVVLGGLMIGLHVYDARLLVIGGTVAHTGDLALRFSETRELPRVSRFWLVPIAIIAVAAIVAILASAGQVATRPFDDDGDVIAQVQRLVDTGALGDAVGYARASQLGGNVALGGLATAFLDARCARLIDGGLGLALLLALVCARIRPRNAAGATWASLLAIGACAVAGPGELVPVWIPAALVVACDGTLQPTNRRGLLPIVLLAAALAALRSEFAPAAGSLLAVQWWLDRRGQRENTLRAAILVGGVLAAIAPYGISRVLAWRDIDPAVRAILEPAHAAVPRLALFVLVAALGAGSALLVTREIAAPRLRGVLIALGIGVAAIVAFGDRPYASHLYLPLAIAAVAVLAIAAAPRRELPAIGLVISLVAVVFVHDAQAATGRLTSWSWRAYDLLFDVEYARHAAPEGGDYERVLEHVPREDAIAVWVARPELLDYARHRIVDVRTPRAARDRNRVAQLVVATHARWLLVEDDVPPALDTFAKQHQAVTDADGVRLVELR